MKMFLIVFSAVCAAGIALASGGYAVWSYHQHQAMIAEWSAEIELRRANDWQLYIEAEHASSFDKCGPNERRLENGQRLVELLESKPFDKGKLNDRENHWKDEAELAVIVAEAAVLTYCSR